ncbi:MAG: ABC transporter permease [Rhodospirillaceae bacterium]|nr:ABC transporter permease [Rhodospirillaceae bacterium]|tara:strand:+ start:2674 stop:4155 length:1482 start_codon:yes stop_codon:yes gene_type:complete
MIVRPEPSPLGRTTTTFVGIAFICFVFADVAITTVDPWQEFKLLLVGIVTPDFYATDSVAQSIGYTLAFAFLGVALSNVLGLVLALLFFSRIVRTFCAVIRAVHELFWALIFLQLFGLSPLTGVLAIAIPYAGIIAKVYAEILEEADPAPLKTVPGGTSLLSTFIFVRLPDAWSHFRSYSMYRLECGIRSSAVLGFIGLPTLGFHLETAFKEGQYSEVSALLILFYVVIATMRTWMRRQLIPVYLIGAAAILPWGISFSFENIVRFLTEDIVPHPLRTGAGMDAFGDWLHLMVFEQALPGTIATVQLTMIALVATGFLTMVLFPLISPLLFGKASRLSGHIFLVVARSTPEYILAFILLQLWGPSMLPAIIALTIHNGAIIGHLVGRYTETMKLRQDASKGINRYAYEVLPRVYRPMLALLFYRWEIIMRETAILGILGIATLGFYVDSAFADLRFDRAMLLIAITAMLNICVDAISRSVRSRLRLQTSLKQQ